MFDGPKYDNKPADLRDFWHTVHDREAQAKAEIRIDLEQYPDLRTALVLFARKHERVTAGQLEHIPVNWDIAQQELLDMLPEEFKPLIQSGQERENKPTQVQVFPSSKQMKEAKILECGHREFGADLREWRILRADKSDQTKKLPTKLFFAET